EDGGRAAQRRVVAVEGLEVDGDEPRLPVVGMEYVRPLAAAAGVLAGGGRAPSASRGDGIRPAARRGCGSTGGERGRGTRSAGGCRRSRRRRRAVRRKEGAR